MSVYRRRVMQVKHPPNQITAVYKVTSTTSATTLFNKNYISKLVQKVYVDGEEITQTTSSALTYKFSTTGEHEVKIIISKAGTFAGKTLFKNAKTLVSVDFSEFRLSIGDASEMFYSCSKLTSVKGLQMGGATTMYQMFYGCSGLTSLDVSKWDTSNVTTFDEAFRSCKVLTSLDVSSWDTSNVTNMYYTFYGCNALISLDASNWDLSKLINAAQIFFNCFNLSELRFNTEINSGTSFSSAFSGAGGDFTKLYYYPHASFVEYFLPKVPSNWQKIDITTLE